MVESSLHNFYYGFENDVVSKAFNLIRDTVFGGNQTAYNIAVSLCSVIAGVGANVVQNYNLVNKLQMEKQAKLMESFLDEGSRQVTLGGNSSAFPANIDKKLESIINDIRIDVGKEFPVGNAGSVMTDIDGVTPEIKSFSKYNNLISSNNINHDYSYNFGKENRIFDTLDVNSQNIINGPKAFNRCIDTESKMLEDIAHQLGYNTFSIDESVVGNVYLCTERAPCPSCENVITQFKTMFPNVKVYIKYLN